MFYESLPYKVQRTTFSKTYRGKIRREANRTNLLRLAIYPDRSFALSLSIEETGDRIKRDDAALLINSSARRPTPMCVPLVVPGVDVHEHHSRNGVDRLPQTDRSTRVPAIVLVRPNVGAVRRPENLKVHALVEQDIDVRITVAEVNSGLVQMQPLRKAVRAFAELTIRAIPNPPVLLRQRANAHTRCAERQLWTPEGHIVPTLA